MLHTFVDWVLATVSGWVYPGIFMLMTLESTVLPIPTELLVIPAGSFAYQGKMSPVSIFLDRYGRYFLFVRGSCTGPMPSSFGMVQSPPSLGV